MKQSPQETKVVTTNCIVRPIIPALRHTPKNPFFGLFINKCICVCVYSRDKWVVGTWRDESLIRLFWGGLGVVSSLCTIGVYMTRVVLSYVPVMLMREYGYCSHGDSFILHQQNGG